MIRSELPPGDCAPVTLPRLITPEGVRRVRLALQPATLAVWVHAVRQQRDQIEAKHRTIVKRVLGEALRKPRESLPRLLDAARELEKPRYLEKNRRACGNLAGLVPVVAALHREALQAAQAEISVFPLGPKKVVAWLDASAAALAARGFDPDIAKAVLLAGVTPSDDENHESADPPEDDLDDGKELSEAAHLDDFWEATISWARSLSPDDAAWDEPQRLEELRELVEAKRAERQRLAQEACANEQRQRLLEQALESLSSYNPEFLYLGLTLRPLTPQQAMDRGWTSEALGEMTASLDSLRTARGLPADTADAEDARHRALSAAKRACMEVWQLLPALDEARVPDSSVQGQSDVTLDSAPQAPAGSQTPDAARTEEKTPAAPAAAPTSPPLEPVEGAGGEPRGVPPKEEQVSADHTDSSTTAIGSRAQDEQQSFSEGQVCDEIQRIHRDERPADERNATTLTASGASPPRESDTTGAHDAASKAQAHEPNGKTGLPLSRSGATDSEESQGGRGDRIAEIWKALSQGDTAGAFWLSASLEAQGPSDEIPPSNLIRALQCAGWVKHSPSLVPALAQIVIRQEVPAAEGASSLALAAALTAGVFYPETHLRAWLQMHGTTASPLKRIVTALSDFADTGYALSPMVIAALRSNAEHERAIAEARTAVKLWMSQSPLRQTRFARATRVWRERLQKELAAILQDCLEGGENASAARDRLKAFNEPGYVDRRIDAADARLRSPGSAPIDFGARKDDLHGLVREAVECASNLLALTEASGPSDWLLIRARALQSTLREEGPRALDALQREREDGASHCSSLVLAHSLRRLLNELQIPLAEPFDAQQWPGLKEFHSLTATVGSLSEGLTLRLLWYPSLDIDGPETLSADHSTSLFAALRKPLPSKEEALEQWIGLGRLDRARALLPLFDDSPSAQSAVERALTLRREKVSHDLREAEASIERGVVDGYAAGQRAALSALLDGVHGADMLDFRPADRAIEQIQQRLRGLRSEHLAFTNERFEELRGRLRANTGAHLANALQSIEDAIRKEDVRAADEAIFQLEERLNAHSDFLPPKTPGAPLRERLEAFRDFSDEYQRLTGRPGGLVGLIRRFGELRFATIKLPTGQKRAPIKAALDAWQRLKNKGAPERQVRELVDYLGFNVAAGEGVVALEREGTSWRSYRVRMNDAGRSPVPQFGSASRGLYRVLCVWERPGADALSGIFHEVSRDPTILFYLGRLSEAQRLNLKNGARQQDLAILCVDENLVVFAAGEHDLRLNAVFGIGVPYALLNPYTPFQAGDVPAEMYFGRREIANRLKDPTGSCILYGGRQLGKSALLRKVQREFHDPVRRNFATVMDIKLLGDPRAGVDTKSFWRLLREELQRHDLLQRNRTSDDPLRLFEAIRAICADGDRRILLLLDEADCFLDADARENFPITDKLRELMAATHRRFKVVLAGLHNVQRFQSLSNQPLAHFGQAVQVGPLDGRDAMALVEEPLAALGFVFESEHDVLRILSYTNYHPGLIQLFCHELTRRLQQRNQQALPPVVIQRELIEGVYLTEQVREGIRERFDWTLALDSRYQAIAWSMILRQKEGDDYSSEQPPSKILEAARFWWPRGFESGVDEFRGILEEMCGLGVLVRGQRGYRLRSPNVIRLLGDIETRLLELGSAEPPPAFDASQMHAPLDKSASEYSPLKFDDSRRVLGAEAGLAVVMGSRAMGLERVPRALDLLAHARDDEHSSVFSVPEGVRPGELEGWLRQELESREVSPHSRTFVVAWGRREGSQDPCLLAEKLASICAQYRRRRRYVRVTLIIAEDCLGPWLASPRRSRVEDENEVVLLRKWTEVGLRARIDHAGMMGEVGHLLDVTGGWDYLVAMALEGAQGANLRSSLDRLQQELHAADSRAREGFSDALGLPTEEKRLLPALLEYSGDGVLKFDDIADLVELLRAEHEWMDAKRMDLALTQLERLGILRRMAAHYQVDPVVSSISRA